MAGGYPEDGYPETVEEIVENWLREDTNDMCNWCNVEREELYMGGGLYVYKCPKCGSRMEYKKQ